jgi:DNA topoisomerase-3
MYLVYLIDSVQGHPAIVESIEKNISRKRAPLLFNLAELQAECAKRFKISPDETLQVAQDLYERKLTTYPRTDARVLSTPVAKEIHKNISRLRGYEPTSDFVEQILDRKLYGNIAGCPGRCKTNRLSRNDTFCLCPGRTGKRYLPE